MAKQTEEKKAKLALVSKISVKNVCGKVNRKELTAEDTALMRVIGIAKGTFTGETDKGQFIGFKGQFKAKDLRTGKEYFSGKLFLPSAASDLLEGQFTGDPKQDAPVNFAFVITAREDESSTVGYVYGVETLIEPDAKDPLILLEDKVNQK